MEIGSFMVIINYASMNLLKLFVVLTFSITINHVLAQDENLETGTVQGKLANGKTVTYATVRAKDGNVWLQQNLGSIAVAKSYSHEWGFGDLYAWGRWSDGHELRLGKYIRQGVAEPNNPEAFKQGGNKNPYYFAEASTQWWWAYGEVFDKWQAANLEEVSTINGCDPCKQILGERWRLPTADEWKKLIKTESIVNVQTAYDSSLKLTAAGYRGVSSGNIQGLKHIGRYWSSTAATKGNAYLLTYDMKGARVGAISRGGGVSVRCLMSN